MTRINVFDFAKSFSSFLQVKEGYKDVHEEAIEGYCELLPSGSGIDSGVKFNWGKSKPEKLIFDFAYHHMNDGQYDGWTEHSVIITPSLPNKFNLKITGRDRDDIKEYLYDVFNDVFTA